MKSGLRGVQVLGVLACLLAMAGCGNGNSSSTSSGTSAAPPSSGGGSNGGSGGLTDQQRMQAAESTASKDALCTTLTPFYWEIGDKDGALDSGSGGDGSSSPPNSETPMAIASASKWVFAAYALERLDVSSSNPLSSSQIQQLNFTSGYDNMDDTACFSTTTVAACFNAANPGGGLNSDQHAVDIGHFYYNGAHMQALAVNQLGLGPDFVNFVAGSPKLAAAIQSYVGQDLTIDYSNPSLAGGADTTAATYGSFLRKILNGDLRMRSYLSADKVCAHANSTDCPTAIYSPINQSEPGTSNDVSDEPGTIPLATGSRTIRPWEMGPSAVPGPMASIPGSIRRRPTMGSWRASRHRHRWLQHRRTTNPESHPCIAAGRYARPGLQEKRSNSPLVILDLKRPFRR
ncbi:MAG TPA: hypothetical protein VGN70_13025 [Gammaproteobacteria bacterium]